MNPQAAAVSKLIEGFRATALIAAAVKLKIIDALADDAQPPEILAGRLQIDAAVVKRLLRGLAVLGLVEEKIDSSHSRYGYRLTAAGALLRTDAAGSLAPYALLSADQYLPAWAGMADAVTEGVTPFQRVFRREVWHYRQENPAQGRLFDQWLHGQSTAVIDEIVAQLDFQPNEEIADIAGGRGLLLSAVLRKFSGCRGVLAEQAAILPQAEAFLRERGVGERCRRVATDFFSSVPAGANAYLLKSVLHDWNDADAVRILNSLRQAMVGGARLIIIERLQPLLAREDPAAIWIDLMMLNVTGGRERSLPEFEELLRQAGFPSPRSIRKADHFHLLEVVLS